jgi:23S rRNA pseudouridine1911/1915/1917 synthase
MPDPVGFQILYEHGGCLVLNKPPGVLTQAVPGVDSLEVRARAYLAACGGSNEDVLRVVHRLDRPATGAIIFAKDLRTTRKLGEQFEKRRVQKVYWACVEGRVAGPTGRWEDFVYKVPGVPRAEVVTADHPAGRHAALHFRVLKEFDWGTGLEIELETGRTHQIRIQAASRGHPVLGDKQYGSRITFGPQFEDERLQAIALHARSLSFRDPETRQTVSVVAPVADYWPQLI